jgi:hypothetical protein
MVAECSIYSICFGLFLAFLDTSIIATALYTIGAEFQSLSKVNWIALACTQRQDIKWVFLLARRSEDLTFAIMN